MAAQSRKARVIIILLIGLSIVVLYYLQLSINQISVPITNDQVKETKSSNNVNSVTSLDTAVFMDNNPHVSEDYTTVVNEEINSMIYKKKQAIVTEENNYILNVGNQTIVIDENVSIVHEKNDTDMNEDMDSIINEEKQTIIPEGTEEMLSTEKAQKEELSCQEGYIFMQDRILPQDITHNHTGKIPKLIHFIVQSRCIPIDLADSIDTTWNTLDDHSIYFHDSSDIQKFISRGKKNALFPSIVDAYNCAKISRAKLEIARFFILWELGGIAIDIDHIPHSIVLQENVLSMDNDECIFEVNKVDDIIDVLPRYIACVPQHSVLYVAITLYITKFNTLHECSDEYDCSLEKLQEEMYLGFIQRMKATRESGKLVGDYITRNRFVNQPFFIEFDITQITPTKGTQLFTPIRTKKEDLDLKILSREEYENQCNAWMVYDKNSFDVNIESLLEVLVGKGNVATFQSTGTTTGACSMLQQYVPNKFNATTAISKSKIPKIIHMTSKTNCVTQVVLNNIRRWFVDGYSFFLHDNEAVDRLIFGREWPEFPLLTESLSCITSGAGKTDLWRNLLLWEYGGIYSEIDNAPGSELFLANHTSAITDDMDAFFEQGKEGYPSQYFFAISPHHPIMYFAVTSTITRLLDTRNVFKQNVELVTGRGAIQESFILATGTDGYPDEGLYPTVHNRTVSVVESQFTDAYIKKNTIRKKHNHYMQMGMASNLKVKEEDQITHSCILEIYKKQVRDNNVSLSTFKNNKN